MDRRHLKNCLRQIKICGFWLWSLLGKSVMCHEIIKPIQDLGRSNALLKQGSLQAFDVKSGESEPCLFSFKFQPGQGWHRPPGTLFKASSLFWGYFLLLCVILPQIVSLPLNVLLWSLGKKYGCIFSLIPHQVGENSSVVLSDVQSGLLVLTDRSEGWFSCHHGQWHSAVC